MRDTTFPLLIVGSIFLYLFSTFVFGDRKNMDQEEKNNTISSLVVWFLILVLSYISFLANV